MAVVGPLATMGVQEFNYPSEWLSYKDYLARAFRGPVFDGPANKVLQLTVASGRPSGPPDGGRS